MPTTQYKEPRKCDCGYITCHPGNWSTHKKRCKVIQAELVATKDGLIASLEKQLYDTRRDAREQLSVKDQQIAAKDKQIDQLIQEAKKPRYTTNKYVVEQNIQNVNVFGHETISHLTHSEIVSLLSEPESAVAHMVKLKQRNPDNANVKCPNMNRAIYQVVVSADDETKQWDFRPRGDVLEKLYDDNSTILEGEAMEEDHLPFLDHQDRVKASMGGNDGGKIYKNQLERIHNVIIGQSRFSNI